MAGKILTPIGYVDEDGKYYSCERVHPDTIEMDPTFVAPRWLFDWAHRQIEDHSSKS
jgi:hypothetical protein